MGRRSRSAGGVITSRPVRVSAPDEEGVVAAVDIGGEEIEHSAFGATF